MALRSQLAGHQAWQSFHQMCYSPELLGVDRRLLVLTGLFGFLLHTATGLYLLPFGVVAVMTLLLRAACKRDPHLLSCLRAAFLYPAAWYDPGLAPDTFGPFQSYRDDESDIPDDPLAELAPPPAPPLSARARLFPILVHVMPRLFGTR